MTIHCRIRLLSRKIKFSRNREKYFLSQNDNKVKMSTKSENLENGDGAQNQNQENKSSILAQMLFTGDSAGLANILNQPVQPVPVQQPVPRKRSLDTDSENDQESGDDQNEPETSKQFRLKI